MNFPVEWTEDEKVKNYLTSESVNEQYRYATKINRNSMFCADRNGTWMNVDSDFQGTRQVDYIKESAPDSKGHRSTLQGLSSEYAESFRVKEKIASTYANRSNAITYVNHYDQPHITIYQRSETDNTDSNNLNYTPLLKSLKLCA